uniref:Cytochrome P450 736A294 n=1 Tax=Leucophyllum frutescens TaxID=86643 RepID=A0A7G6J4K7_LEUFR|nr:cytochrome P450 736A294 [Leucophyllum frutescens]
MASFWIISLITVIIISVLQSLLKPAKKKKLPPGPMGLPIIGHFHLLGKNPNEDLYRLAQKYGPIMYMRFGSMPTVLVSSPAAAELFLKTHDLNFASRSPHEASKYISYEQRNMAFAKYGTYWRDMRKLSTLELFSGLKVRQFQPMRRTEVRLMVESLKPAAERGETVDMSLKSAAIVGDIMNLTVFGRKFGDNDLDHEKGFKEVLTATMAEAAAINIVDFFPYLKWLNLLGASRRIKNLAKKYDKFVTRIIDDHLQSEERKGKNGDFVDTMMAIVESGEAGFEFDSRNVKAVLLDMILAGTDTAASAVEWTLSEIIKNPMVMKRLQKELEEVVGMDQLVEESHLPNLKYLECVVKESLRIHPPVLLLPHSSIEDCEVDGYYIPGGTRTLINIWAIGRDPVAWPNPEKFDPDRFVDSKVDLRGHDFHLLPFGSGRRGCPGLQLGLVVIQYVVAQLVHCFDWELPNQMSPDQLDMSEHYGLVSCRATHLMAIPTYRIRDQTKTTS